MKYRGYKTATVIWHESIPDDFDPVGVLRSLADSRGLIAKETAGRTSRRLRVDTAESLKRSRTKRSTIDKATRAEASKLLRRALRDPRSAQRIKNLVERARQGENVDEQLAEAIEPESDE